MRKRKILLVFLMILTCFVGIVIIYNNQNKTDRIDEFNTYLANYKDELNNYILDEKEEEYNFLISQEEEILNSNDDGKINLYKNKLETFKETLKEYNNGLLSTYLSEVKLKDISCLNNKDKVTSDINEVQKLIDDEKFKLAKEKCDSLSCDIEEQLEMVKEKNYKNLDGFWIGDIDNPIDIRIDLKNMTLTHLCIDSESFSEEINSWDYDNYSYILKCSFKKENPFRSIGQKQEYSFIYVDENHIKVNDIMLYKVSYEQAAYYYLYETVMNGIYDIFYICDKPLVLPDEFLKDADIPKLNIDIDKSKETLKSIICTDEVMKFNRKLEKIYEITENTYPRINLDDKCYELIKGVYGYRYSSMGLIYPPGHKNDDTIHGQCYYTDSVLNEGVIINNKIVIKMGLDNKRFDDLKNEVMTYYR